MIIDVETINPDGTKTTVPTEYPDGFFDVLTSPPTAEEKLRADVDFLAMVTGVDL